jgi:hypothetical protein
VIGSETGEQLREPERRITPNLKSMPTAAARLRRSFADKGYHRMGLAEEEGRLGITLSDRHRRAMMDSADPIHEACDFLVPESPYELLRWAAVNEFLHASDRWNRWPHFLVAFASNGCGDYFAYDTRTAPAKIIYIDPDKTVDENLSKTDRFEFDTFEAWYEMKLGQWRTSRCT